MTVPGQRESAVLANCTGVLVMPGPGLSPGDRLTFRARTNVNTGDSPWTGIGSFTVR